MENEIEITKGFAGLVEAWLDGKRAPILLLSRKKHGSI